MAETIRAGQARREARRRDGVVLRPVLREEERVTALELFFDLVFVLAITQCTALMASDPSWAGLARGLLVLAVLWWAWTGYAWLTSVVNPEEGVVRLSIFAAMAALLVAALCVPTVFEGSALLFAAAYAVVRVGHIVLFVLAGRGDPVLLHSVVDARREHGGRRRADLARGGIRRLCAGRALGRRGRPRLRRAVLLRVEGLAARSRTTSPSGTS